MSKVILGLLFFSCLISISGCQTITKTAKGFGTGITTVIAAPLCGFGKGVAEDAVNTWEAIDKADKWFEENYW